ncbi:signal transduction protein PmrD, partial [Shigella sonnei]|nr:signal transduction protein PmrD [Shigella sonnei]
MQWNGWHKKSCCNKQDNRHVLMLCDAGGAIKM